MYRVEKNSNIVVLRLLPPDAAGNSHWAVVAKLRPDDVVFDRAGNVVYADDARPADIIRAVLARRGEQL